MNKWRAFLTPNTPVTVQMFWTVTGIFIAVWLTVWTVFRPQLFPSPVEVLAALPNLWVREGLGDALFTSFLVNWEALGISTLLALGLAYVSTVPAALPVVGIVARLRFVSPVVFLFALEVMTSSGWQLKIVLLTMGITVFFLTNMADVISMIPAERYDHARTLRMSEWDTVWYVIVNGSRVQALDAIRENAAMGWAMLTMVEGLVRGDGGVGVLIIDQNKHFNLAEVYAVALVVIAVGMLQDYLLCELKFTVAPYAERK